MVAAILYVYTQTGTFNILELQLIPLPANVQTWAFLAFALAFALVALLARKG